MTIHHLRIFIAVAETGSMNAAARRLYLSQSAVSQAIKEMEKHYEMLLFERIGKRIKITNAGDQLLQKAYRLVSEFDKMEKEMKQAGDKHVLRVGATITVGTHLLSVILRRLEKRVQEVEVYVYVGNTAKIEEMLLSSQLDVALVEGQVKSKNLISIPVIRDFLVLACSKKHPLGKKNRLDMSMINNQNFVMREKGSGTRALFDQFLHNHHLDVRCMWEATAPDSFRNAVLFNNCMAVVSIRLLRRDILEDRLRIFKPETDEFERNFSLVYHKDKEKTSIMNLFEEVVRTHVQPEWMSKVEIGKLV